MTFSSYKSRLTSAALLALLAFGGTGCADESFPDAQGEPGTLTLHIGATGTRADADDRGQVAADDNERQINDFRYFFFPTEGSTGTFKTGELTLTGNDDIGKGVDYVLDDFTDGEYNLYIVANVPEAASCTSETGLQKVMLDHQQKLTENYLKNGKMNLPMIAEVGKVTIAPKQYNTARAELKFACAKVSYRLLFYGEGDKLRNGSPATRPFGKGGFYVDKVTASNLSPATHLTLAGNDLTAVYKTDTPLSHEYTPSYSDSWTDNGTGTRDKEEIVPGTSGATPLGGRYIVSGTMYLPERYVENADKERRVKLTFDGWSTDATASVSPGSVKPAKKTEHSYEVYLNHQENDGSWQLARGTYYELIAEVVNPQSTQLDATLNLATWTVHNMAGDLSHTTLTVDRTDDLKVTSIDTDSVRYESNATVTLGCDTKYTYNGKTYDLITETSNKDNILTFGLNPAIPFSCFGEGDGKLPSTGNIKIHVQAGNIRKYLTVHYDVSPFFEVTPSDHVIYYDPESATSNPDYHIRYFDFTTNLRGIVTQGFSFGARYNVQDDGSLKQDADGVLKIELAEGSSSDAATGRIKVTAMEMPSKNMDFSFRLNPVNSDYVHLGKEVQVSVKRKADKYMIYFRPINDNQEPGDKSFYTSYNSNPKETTAWNVVKENVDQKYTRAYIYTQMGQTIGGEIPKDWVWLFTGSFGSDDCNTSIIDSNGWYLKELDANKEGELQEGNDAGKKKPNPGITLIIFGNGTSNTPHRMAHADEPGIQLFDYEDKEGYYIYDPLCTPYYKVFDSRPEIVAVHYRIYTKRNVEISKFYIKYGGAKSDNYKIEHNLSKNEVTDKYGIGWNRYDFFAQCPEGNYAKSLKLVFSDNSEQVIFGGKNFYNAANPGWAIGRYDNGEWTMGEIAGSTDASTKKVYVHTTLGTPYLYVWNNSGNGGDFPGITMNSIGNDWYELNVKKDYTYCIVSLGGSSTQTSNLSISGDSEHAFEFKKGNMYYAEPTNSRP